MSSPAASGSATADQPGSKQPKVDKSKDTAKAKSASTPITKSSLFQSFTSFGSSSSTSRDSKQSGSRTSPQSQPSTIQSPTEPKAKTPAAAVSNIMPPPPLPASASKSSSSSPGSTPKHHDAALPPTSAMQSKSDPVLQNTLSARPHVSITPPQRDRSPAAPAATSSASSTLATGRTRPRGQSTSTIRPSASPTGSVSGLSIGSVAMTRVISNPLPQPTSRASSPGRGAGRGRAVSLTAADKRPSPSPPASRDESGSRDGHGRGRSPLRDLALSWTSFRNLSQPSSPVDDARPATAPSARSGDDAEKRYWWHTRAETPRPWFDDGGRGGDAQSVFAHHAPTGAGGAATPREHVSLWHRKGSVPSEQSESWVRTKQRVEAVTSAVLGNAVVDTALDVTREVLEAGSEVLQFAPVAGLAEAARVLVNIWNAVQLVEFNRLQCLRITERCANILLAVKQEIEEADKIASSSSPKFGSPSGSSAALPRSSSSPRIGANDSPKRRAEAHIQEVSSAETIKLGLVGNRLRQPLERLIDAFNQVLDFLVRQNRRPFLKRYLKRDEIQRDLLMCDAALRDALSMFEVSIQIRTLEQILRAEEQRQADTNMLLDHILHTPPYAQNQLPPYQTPRTYAAALSVSPTADNSVSSLHDEQRHVSSGDGLLLQGAGRPDTAQSLDSLDLNIAPIDDDLDHHPLESPFDNEHVLPSRPAIPSVLPTTEPQVRSTLAEVTQWQNAHDSIRDLADLRHMLRRARDDDSEMARLLQVRPEEAPEALKALQRALEDEIAREREERERFASAPETSSSGADEEDASVGSMQGILDGVLGGHNSTESVEVLGASFSRRSDDAQSRRSSASQTSSAARASGASDDTLDREFMESVKDSLVRLSIAAGRPAVALSLPSWTITRYEVDLQKQIGHGSFSEVWRGRYRKRTVAVKILQSWTPKEMFLREVHVWNDLRHPNILEMVGASAVEPPSIPGEQTRPWFIVSRYYQRGSLVRWLPHLSTREWQQMLDDVGKGVLRMIHEVVLGMQYLHDSGVLHGDLKCANVLVNDYGHCVISDFGQSEIKSEIHRLSGNNSPQGGTLRWQAPELMGGLSKLTQEADVYAFAVSCYELLTKGDVPWPTADDPSIRHFILTQNLRPELPALRPWSGQLAGIIGQCWALKPSDRPSFAELEVKINALRKQFGWIGVEQVELGEANEEEGWLYWIDELDKEKEHKSPSLAPNRPLPSLPPGVIEVDEPSFSSGSYVTAHASTPERTATDTSSRPPSIRESMSAPPGEVSQVVPPPTGPSSHSAPERVPPSAPSSIIHAPTPSRGPSLPPSSSDSESVHAPNILNSLPPEPLDARRAEARNERRYRMILQHEFHPSLSLPLWSPSPVKVGAVGYHQMPEGAFVTLFDAFRPLETSGGRTRGMPSLAGYGNVTISSQEIRKRNTAQRMYDQIHGLVSRKNISRRYSSPLRTGHKTAHLFTETTLYQYVADPDLSAPRHWFQANVEQILEIYGTEHAIQKEDLMLVIGTLDAADYALFVSHSHPNGEVDFEVFARTVSGEAWGKFTTTTDLSDSIGPIYDVPGEERLCVNSGSKVSLVKRPGEAWDTVLLARLRFLTDKEEPTSQ